MQMIRARLDPSMTARVVRSVPLRYADGADAALDRPAHVRSASGIVRAGGRVAVIQDDAGRILLIRRTDNDLYSIPGGGVELGETLTQTVKREVLEETGINVQVTDLIGVYSDPAHVIEFTDGEVRQEFSICFRATPVGGELRTSDVLSGGSE